MMVREKISPAKVTGARFVCIVALVIGLLAASLSVSRLLARLTGIGAFDAIFLLCAVCVILMLMRGTVVGYAYTLRDDGVLVLEKDYGDKVNSLIEVRTEDVSGVRAFTKGERLKKTYRTVTRFCPAKRASHVVVYRQEGREHAAVFAPSAALCNRIEEAVRHAK